VPWIVGLLDVGLELAWFTLGPVLGLVAIVRVVSGMLVVVSCMVLFWLGFGFSVGYVVYRFVVELFWWVVSLVLGCGSGVDLRWWFVLG